MPKPTSPPSSREIVSRNLRLVRSAKNLSQEEVALAAGVSRGYVSRVERGDLNPSFDQMDMIAMAVGVPLHDLINPKLFQALGDAD